MIADKESYSQNVKGTVSENLNTTIASYCESNNFETDKSKINDDTMITNKESYSQNVKGTVSANLNTIIADYCKSGNPEINEESNNAEVDESGIESTTGSLASDNEKSNNVESNESGIEELGPSNEIYLKKWSKFKQIKGQIKRLFSVCRYHVIKHEGEKHNSFDTKKTKPNRQIEENTNEGSSKANSGFFLEFDIKKKDEEASK